MRFSHFIWKRFPIATSSWFKVCHNLQAVLTVLLKRCLQPNSVLSAVFVFMDIMFPPSGILVVLMMQFLEVKTLSLSLHKWWISFKTTAHSQYIAGTSGHYKFWQNIWVNCCLEWRLISSDFFSSKNSEPETGRFGRFFGVLKIMEWNVL